MKKPLTPEEALYRAAALCSTAERCASEIEEKLSRWGVASPDIRRIVAHLHKEGYIDEARYCRSFVHDKIQFDRWGRLKISAALRQKRLPDADVADALALIDETSYRQLLRELIDRKRRQLDGSDPRADKAKLLRFALSRGFETGIIFSILGRDDYDDTCDD